MLIMNKAAKKPNYKKYYPFHRSRLLSQSSQDSFRSSPSTRFSPQILKTELSKQNISPAPPPTTSQLLSQKSLNSNSLPDLKSHSSSFHSIETISSSILRHFEQSWNPSLRIEACKIVRKWVKLSPQRFPQRICAALVALSESDQDDLQDFALELLRLLSIKNCSLVARCGGLRVLVKWLLNPRCSQFSSENLALTFSFLLNEGHTRQFFNDGKEILRIFAVFLEPETMNRNQKEVVVRNVRNALVLMVRSWAGLIFFTCNGLGTVVKALNDKVEIWIKEEIVEMFFEMIDVQSDTSGNQFNMINNYLAILLKALVDAGITQELIKLLKKADKNFKVKVEKLAVLLCKLLKNLIPTVQDLSAFLESEKLQIFPEKPKNSYLSSCFTFIQEKSLLKSIKNKENPFFLEFIENQFDEPSFLKQLHQSKVHKPHKKWRWKLILDIITGPLEQNNKFLLPQSIQFIHSLISYFTPSKNLFHLLPWHSNHFDKARVARALIELLLMKEEGCLILNSSFSEGFFQTRKSFLHEFFEGLDEEIKFLNTGEDGTLRVFSQEKVKNCMARECFLLVEIFLRYPQGRKLLKANKITAILVELFAVDHLAVLLLNVVDYSKQKWRHFMELMLNSNDWLRLKAIERLQSLYSSGTKDLSWSLEYLKSQLISKNPLIISSTLSLLHKLTNEHVNLLTLLHLGSQELFYLNKAGKRVLLNFLKYPEGIHYLSSFGFLEKELILWNSSLNNKYARAIELSIEKGLEPQKANFFFHLPMPPQSQGKVITWASRLPFNVVVVSGKKRRIELDPVILATFEGLEVLGVINSQIFFDEGLAAGLSMGLVSLDSSGNETYDEFLVPCAKELQNLEVQRDGVTFSFVNNSRPLLKTVRFSFKLFDHAFKSAKTKKHLFGLLSQTAEGVKIVKELGYIQRYFLELQKSSETLIKRSLLWALGHFGSNEFGALVLKELGVIRFIASIAENSSTLSLRGTAFQTLSLMCRGPLGRAELGLVGWTCNGVAFIALPKDSGALFRIPKAEAFLPYMKNLDHIEKVLKKCRLQQSEEEVLKLITGLGSLQNKSKCEVVLRNIRRAFPGLFLSSGLFKCVNEVISGYKFSLSSRMFIHRLFDIFPLVDLEKIKSISPIFNT